MAYLDQVNEIITTLGGDPTEDSDNLLSTKLQKIITLLENNGSNEDNNTEE